LNATEYATSFAELEQQMDSNSTLLLREMHRTPDEFLQRRLYEQAADQEASLISEVLEGSVVTDFSFTTAEGRLYLIQPNGVTDWQQMHELGVARAEAKAADDSRFRPYVEIARAELEESRLQEEMVKTGRPAAMAKLSLCGDDVMSAEELEKLGRDPKARRAFLRVSVFDGQQLHIHSRSIDGLDLADGRGLADGWGTFQRPLTNIQPAASSIDILNNQLYFEQDELDLSQMHQLADELVAGFDALQRQRTGRAYKAGRTPEGVNTYEFVLANQDLLKAHMDSLVSLAKHAELPIGHVAAVTNSLRYDIMSSYKQRLEGRWEDLGSLAESVAAAGETERANGTEFWGCDSIVSPNTANTGYVNAEGGHGPTRSERRKIVKNLREQVIGKGSCSACGAKGKLFGCGLCNACNKEWCDKYESSGEQMAINKLGRARSQQKPLKTESFSEYWARLGRKVS